MTAARRRGRICGGNPIVLKDKERYRRGLIGGVVLRLDPEIVGPGGNGRRIASLCRGPGRRIGIRICSQIPVVTFNPGTRIGCPGPTKGRIVDRVLPGIISGSMDLHSWSRRIRWSGTVILKGEKRYRRGPIAGVVLRLDPKLEGPGGNRRRIAPRRRGPGRRLGIRS